MKTYEPNGDPGAQYIALANPADRSVETLPVLGWGNSGEGWPDLTPVTPTPDGPQPLPFQAGRQYAYGPTEGDAWRALQERAQAQCTGAVYEAINVLYVHRHSLPTDVLRSMQSIYLCASAARYGALHEVGWLDEDEFRADYGDHDSAQCEAEDGELRHSGTDLFALDAEASQP